MPVYTTQDGTRLNYVESGSGTPALILVHGWCSNLHHWDPQARAFGRTHRVLRVDLRGHGRSDAPAGGYSIRQFADDVAALARSRRIRSAVVMGHSMGGLVALEFARRHRDLARALVMVDAPAGLGGATRASLADNRMMQILRGEGWPAPPQQFYAGFFADARDHDLAARVITDAGRTPRHSGLAAFEALLTYNLPVAAKQVKQPALFIAASKGAARWDQLRGLIPQIQFARVVGAGHFLQLEAPDQCNAMIKEFIARL